MYSIRIFHRNLDSPMAKHLHSTPHSYPDSLIVEGVETFKKNIWAEKLSIYIMQATLYPGLNQDIDFSPFLSLF